MNVQDIIQSDSDLDSNQDDFICDSDSDIEIISESYFDINVFDTLKKSNNKLKKNLLKAKQTNETIKENLSISKNTIGEMNKMITELTEKLTLQENTNKEIMSKLSKSDEKNILITQKNKKLDEQIEELSYDKKCLKIQVGDFSKSETNWEDFKKSMGKTNCFLSRAVCFFFLVSCSSIIYNYKINKSNS